MEIPRSLPSDWPVAPDPGYEARAERAIFPESLHPAWPRVKIPDPASATCSEGSMREKKWSG